MGIFSALFGFVLVMLALIVVAALILSPILIPRYLRSRRAEQTRTAAMQAQVDAATAALSRI